MIQYIRVTSDDAGFRQLIHQLDIYLAVINGDENAFFTQYNKVDLISHVIMAYSDDSPIGCGAIKEYVPGTMEVKRMFVLPENRGKGIASRILSELEIWAKELGYDKCILETSEVMKDAIGLYTKGGYQTIPNYGQYKNVATSVCFEKILIDSR